MALSEMGLSIGARRSLPDQEVYTAVKKPDSKRLYTQQEITNMMLIPPPDLDIKERADTPAGTWLKDGKVSFFDPKPTEEVDKITKPNVKQRLSSLAKIVFQMS